MNIYAHNDLFLKNEETTRYYKIVESAQKEQRKKYRRNDSRYVYYEAHHVLPKSIFPEYTKEKWNIVLLYAHEHLMCHQLLVNMVGQNTKAYHQMVCAYKYMSTIKDGGTPRYALTPLEYEVIRIMYSESRKLLPSQPHTEKTKSLISAANKGRKPSDQAIINSVLKRRGAKRPEHAVSASAEAQRGNTNVRGKTKWNNGIKETLSFTHPGDGWRKGGFPRSEETRRKISENNKLRVVSEETKEKMCGRTRWTDGARVKFQRECPGPEWHKGCLLISEETRRKQSESHRGMVHSEDTRRKRSESIKNWKRPATMGANISAAKKGKKTNQQEIMGRRYAAMTDDDFNTYIAPMKSLLAKNRATNLRNKWIQILSEGKHLA